MGLVAPSLQFSPSLQLTARTGYPQQPLPSQTCPSLAGQEQICSPRRNSCQMCRACPGFYYFVLCLLNKMLPGGFKACTLTSILPAKSSACSHAHRAYIQSSSLI